MSSLNYGKESPAAYKALFGLEEAVKATSLEKSLIDLVKIRASQINGCLLCIDMHIKEAKIKGEKELRLHHLVAWHESPLFTPREKAALEWTEKVTRISNGVPNEDLQKLLQHFTEKEASDLTFAVVTINAWNRFGVAFHGEPGSYDKLLGLDKAGLNL